MDRVEWMARKRKTISRWWDQAGDLRWLARGVWTGVVVLFGLVLRIAIAVGLVVLAVRVADSDLDPGTAAAAGGLLVAALIALAITPRYGRGLLHRLSKFNIGPVGLELLSDAAAPKASAEDPDRKESKEGKATSLVDLRLKIERKLAYVAKDLLDEDGTPTFVTVGSLEYDGFISRDEARTVSRLASLRDEDLDVLGEADRRAFIDAANKVSGNIRASVLNGLVRKLLRKAKWDVIEIPRTPRPDLLAEKGTQRFLVVPVFATAKESGTLENALDRLSAEKVSPRNVDQRIVVLPHNSRSPRTEEINKEQRVVVFDTDQLVGFLTDGTVHKKA